MFNSVTLTTYIKSISGIKYQATLDDFHPLGAAWPTPVDTGLRTQDPIVLEMLYDGGGASTPPTACAVGTSATLTVTLATGQTVSGTFISTDMELGITTEGSHTCTVTLTPSGTITYDVAA